MSMSFSIQHWNWKYFHSDKIKCSAASVVQPKTTFKVLWISFIYREYRVFKILRIGSMVFRIGRINNTNCQEFVSSYVTASLREGGHYNWLSKGPFKLAFHFFFLTISLQCMEYHILIITECYFLAINRIRDIGTWYFLNEQKQSNISGAPNG